jgi:hypothetical protein
MFISKQTVETLRDLVEMAQRAILTKIRDNLA